MLKLKKLCSATLAMLLALSLLASCGNTGDEVPQNQNPALTDGAAGEETQNPALTPALAVEPTLTYTKEDFDAFFEKYVALIQALSVVYWDIETGGTPPGAFEARSKTIGILSTELFDMGISDEMRGFFAYAEQAIESGEADDVLRAMYSLTKSDYDKLMCIPADEYAAFAELTANTPNIWAEAKGQNDFSMFAPSLQAIMDYQRKIVDYRAAAGIVYDNPYDAMLDDFEPGMTVKELDAFFDDLRSEIVPLLKAVTEAEKEIRTDFLSREVPVSVQKNVADLLINTVGFDMNRGVRAESEHPFTTSIGQSDVRITAKYTEDKFFNAFFAIMHESGHGIYMQNADKSLEGTILDNGASLAIHESQSRFLENMVGRSLEFWEGIYDDFIAVTEGYFDDVSVMELYEAVNLISPSFIRISADELTYSLHIMVRYEIEKMIFNNPELTAEDLPAIWNEKMLEYLGITPETDSEGILQDIHWSYGEFGYFPTYALGNAYAAQMKHYMDEDFDTSAAVREQNISLITDWLADKVHRHGALLTPDEILSNITDEGFSSEYYVNYLKDKYAEIYNI
ncbi:MAG: carboxypeptidase M32 [Oscillospiraceae bacterium]|nr:carboxypeptidase M32 [Oscillospiraceae bacterium]